MSNEKVSIENKMPEPLPALLRSPLSSSKKKVDLNIKKQQAK